MRGRLPVGERFDECSFITGRTTHPQGNPDQSMGGLCVGQRHIDQLEDQREACCRVARRSGVERRHLANHPGIVHPAVTLIVQELPLIFRHTSRGRLRPGGASHQPVQEAGLRRRGRGEPRRRVTTKREMGELASQDPLEHGFDGRRKVLWSVSSGLSQTGQNGVTQRQHGKGRLLSQVCLPKRCDGQGQTPSQACQALGGVTAHDRLVVPESLQQSGGRLLSAIADLSQRLGTASHHTPLVTAQSFSHRCDRGTVTRRTTGDLRGPLDIVSPGL